MGLDTSAIIDLRRGDAHLAALLKDNNEPLVLNHLVYLELMSGIDRENKNHKEEEYYYDSLFNSFQTLSLTFLASKKTSDIIFQLKKKGKTIETFDCVIAGIYLANGVKKIITKNRKHFEAIEGIEVLSY